MGLSRMPRTGLWRHSLNHLSPSRLHLLIFFFIVIFPVPLHIEKLLLLQIRTLWSLSTIFILELFIHTIQMLLTILFPSMDCLLFIPFLLQTLEMASL